ncbi:DUF6265 family protein [Piscinibacter sp. XHJ-5]|uniref:DUF6265 family protein n=1 Tax=Piscinibacter sp. XHJ-5 TaxID=3037797 RepID=UPI002452822C|nr:DUF6265 family protein [Piscinibacter sp. XHJ-5]
MDRRMLLLLALLVVVPVRAEDTALTRLGWLAGCWRSESGDAGSGEHWMPLAGGTMLGIGRTVRQGRTVEHEFLQIREVDGRLVYIATPSGQKTAMFTAARVGDGEVMFENPQHDFPQRILYRREGQKLHARIEGMRNGAPRGIDYPMQRVPCDGLAGTPSS